MSNKNEEIENNQEVNADMNSTETNLDEQSELELSEIDKLKNELNDVQEKLEEEKKNYLYLMAEFDNFRKRTIKDKTELIKNATESAMKGILPIIDDFERALNAMQNTDDINAVIEGVDLIYHKFIKYLEQNGVKEIISSDAEFDTEYHEAVAMVPAADDSMKGKVIDTISKGYMINDKVLRHAKVAVAQ